jgi:hypothetical protein
MSDIRIVKNGFEEISNNRPYQQIIVPEPMIKSLINNKLFHQICNYRNIEKTLCIVPY